MFLFFSFFFWENYCHALKILFFQVSKPYAEFFSDANLKVMEVKESTEVPLEDMEISMAVDYNPDQGGQAAAADWGEGGEEGGFDEDWIHKFTR